MGMTRRRRIARILDRLSSWVFSPYAEQWQSVTQESLDRLIDLGAGETSETCDKCGAPANPPGSYWFAPNDLWNEVHGSPSGFRCIPCFTRDCAQAGITIGWRAGLVGDIDALIDAAEHPSLGAR